MDFTHLPLAQTPNSYGFDAELASGSYGTPGGISQLPRSLSSGLGLQSSSFAQSPAPKLPGEQLPWPQRVLSEIQDLLLLLSPDGIVNYVSPSCSAITGFDTAQLEHNHLSRFIHDEDKAIFTQELNVCITTARPLRCHFRMYQVDNSTCLMEACGHPHLSTLNNDVIQQHFCHGVFLVCRPYHTQSTQLLDSFLERKLENIRLKERIAQMKRDEENDLNATAQQTNLSQAHSSAAHRPVPQSSKTFSSAQLGHSTLASLDPSMIYGEDNESSDTLSNVDDLDVNQAKPILNEEGTSHLNGIELMTGLFLIEGERSQGISTGAPECHLYHFTGGNPPLEPQVPPRNEPRKKLKGQYRCADCGTSDSPEWRKGPGGPKTLCNACGLRWAKKKKRQVSG